MIELLEAKAQRVATQVRVDWSPAEEALQLRLLERRLTADARQRRLFHIGVGVTAVAATLLLALGAPRLFSAFHAAPAQLQAVTPPQAPPLLRLRDGSRVDALIPGTQVQLELDSPLRTTLRLQDGQARFDVTRNPSRSFEVWVEQLRVQVIGTAFTVARSGNEVTVAVERGRVRVSLDNNTSELGAGQQHQYSLPAAAPAVAASTGLSVAAEPSNSPEHSGVAPWRTLAEQGDFSAAYGLLSRSGASVNDSVQELLLAADAARLSGHPNAALPFLQRVKRHRGDARAALGAFTAGRILLMQLGRPAEAAAEFASAQVLSPGGALYEDALAREVEAWYRSGRSAQASAAAARYLRRFPTGRWAKMVRTYGGVD